MPIYQLIEFDYHYDDVAAVSAAAALEIARNQFNPDAYPINYDEDGYARTLWVEIYAHNPDDLYDSAWDVIAIDPTEPDCSEAEHDWHQDSVHGHGGGVIIHDVCRHCGLVRVTDTWAQNPSTGQQGLRSVSYRDDMRAETR